MADIERRPTHPGAIFAKICCHPQALYRLILADRLGASRLTVQQILREQSPLSVDMAIRLSHFLGTTLESWLNMQQALDIWDLPHKNARIYQQIETEAS